MASTQSSIGQAICGKPGKKWCPRIENAATRFTGFGMTLAPCGNSAISTRCGYAAAPNCASMPATASGCATSGRPSAAAAAWRV